MNKTIWKFPLKVTDEQEVCLPEVASILSAQVIGEDLFMWAVKP